MARMTAGRPMASHITLGPRGTPMFWPRVQSPARKWGCFGPVPSGGHNMSMVRDGSSEENHP